MELIEARQTAEYGCKGMPGGHRSYKSGAGSRSVGNGSHENAQHWLCVLHRLAALRSRWTARPLPCPSSQALALILALNHELQLEFCDLMAV